METALDPPSLITTITTIAASTSRLVQGKREGKQTIITMKTRLWRMCGDVCYQDIRFSRDRGVTECLLCYGGGLEGSDAVPQR